MAQYSTYDNFMSKLKGDDPMGAIENVLLNLELCKVKFEKLIKKFPDEVAKNEIKTMISNLGDVRKEVKIAERNFKREYDLEEVPPFTSYYKYFGPSGTGAQPKQLGASSVGNRDVVIRTMFVPMYDELFKECQSAKQLYRVLTDDKILAFLRVNNGKMEEYD